MGLLLPTKEGILVEDFLLVRQEASLASVNLDMDWWADKQIELYDKHGIEPWRTSCWTHTHPAGVNQPSSTDEQTMVESFGGWDFILMLILTKTGQFYGRMDFDQGFGTGARQRLSAACRVEIDWGNPGKEAITGETLKRWEAEFRGCVHETQYTWCLFEDSWPQSAKPRKAAKLPGPRTLEASPGELSEREEVEEYVQACRNMGYDPNDPGNFEDYFGYEPNCGR